MHLTFLGTGDAFCAGGRFNSCLHLTGDGATLLIDCGATSQLALARANVDRNSIGTILFTHFHGDHFAGLPIFILDALFVSARTTPLVIAGPRGIATRTKALIDATYPGFFEREKPFAMTFVEVTPETPAQLGPFAVTAFPMVHDDLAGPCQGYRIANGDRVLAFTGDTGWTDALIPLAAGADLLVSECCTVDKEMPMHLSFATLMRRRSDLMAKRLILTHMGPDMLALDVGDAAEKAHDGLVVTI